LRGLKIGYELFDQKNSVKMIPLLGGWEGRVITFSPVIHIFIFNAIDAQRGRLHLLFGHHKQWGSPAKKRRETLP